MHRGQRRAVLTQSGGTHSAGNVILGQYAGSAGTYNLNGGLLSLSALSQGSGTAAFNFAGGTFQAASSFISNVPIVLATAGNNAVFDTMNNALSLSAPLSGSGGLQKLGAGALVLFGSSSYSGGTVVSAGQLYLNGSATTPSVSVAAGATLGGLGAANAATVTVDDGGGLEAGYQGTGGLTVSGLTFSNAGTISLTNLGNYTAAPAVAVTGLNGFSTNGGYGSVTIVPGGSLPLGSGTAHLIQYAGSVQGSGASAVVVNLTALLGNLLANPPPAPAARHWQLSVLDNPGSIDFAYNFDYPIWSGGGDGT